MLKKTVSTYRRTSNENHRRVVFVEKKMTPAQIAEANKLARECVRKKYKGCWVRLLCLSQIEEWEILTETCKRLFLLEKNGGESGIWTPDQRIMIPLL